MDTPLHNLEDPEPTILSWLNEDCWRSLLNYLPIEDIVRSERVSRQWQGIVKDYLQGIRIRMQYRRFRRGETRGGSCRILTLDDPDPVLFERMTSKLGPLVVAGDCINQASFRSVVKNCPNIESVTISGKIDAQLMTSQVANFKRLKRIAFKRCRFLGMLHGNYFHADIPDFYVRSYLESETLEELKIYNNAQVTGRCLFVLRHNLKSLYLINCPSMDFDTLLLSTDRLTELTKLILNENPAIILQNVHLLLDQMPKLEHLSLSLYEETELSREVVKSISRLGRLRHLCVKENQNVTDDWLEALANGCRQLQTVDVGGCRDKRGPVSHCPINRVTPDGLRAMCRGLRSLSALSVAYNHNLSNEDVVGCISICPSLTTLDLQGCGQLTSDVIDKAERAARGRPHPLRLRLYASLSGTTGEMERHGSLILDFDPREWRITED